MDLRLRYNNAHMHDRSARNILRRVMVAAVALTCANVLVLLVAGTYDLGIRGFVAHGLFKPLLWLNGAVFMTVLLRPAGGKTAGAPPPFPSAVWFAAAVLALVTATYFWLLPVDFSHHDWTHRHISAGLTSFDRLAELFTTPQPDGFFRPLGFLSLWLDYSIFGEQYWAYHLQSLILHALNVLLAYRLFKSLGFIDWCSQWAALLFSVAAVCVEPLIWPAARFDLLCAAFILAALLLALRYLRGQRGLALFAAAYCLALMSKETAYAVPVILMLLLPMLKPDGRRRVAPLAAVAAAVTLAAIAGRLALFGNFGGYGWDAAVPPPALGVKMPFYIVTRALFIPPLAVNTAADVPLWAKAGLLALVAAGVLATGFARAQSRARQTVLLGCAVASALPAAAVLGWVGPSAAGSRNLYLPALWIFLFIAQTAQDSPRSTWIVMLVMFANVAGSLHNIGVYRESLARADSLAARVRSALIADPSACRVELLDVPSTKDGVMFFRDEVAARTRARVPRPDIGVYSGAGPAGSSQCAVLRFRWDASKSDLVGAGAVTRN